MFLLIIDNTYNNNKIFIVRMLTDSYEKILPKLLTDTEIIYLIINEFVKEFDDDPEKFYFDETTYSPNIEKFKTSLSNKKFYKKVAECFEKIIDMWGNFVEIDNIIKI